MPPKSHFTKEWIRLILGGQKKLLHRADVKPVDVSDYPELAVKRIFDEFAERLDCKLYIPPKINSGRSCPKEYFWDVVASLYE